MADHLPECLLYPHAEMTYRCICDRLRACETRVRMDGINAVVAAQANSYQQGLAAAREAVVAQKVKWSIDYDTALDDALAAIDALAKGEQE